MFFTRQTVCLPERQTDKYYMNQSGGSSSSTAPPPGQKMGPTTGTNNRQGASGTIRQFRSTDPMDKNQSQQTWEALKNAIHQIHAHNASQLSFEELYNINLYYPLLFYTLIEFRTPLVTQFVTNLKVSKRIQSCLAQVWRVALHGRIRSCPRSPADNRAFRNSDGWTAPGTHKGTVFFLFRKAQRIVFFCFSFSLFTIAIGIVIIMININIFGQLRKRFTPHFKKFNIRKNGTTIRPRW